LWHFPSQDVEHVIRNQQQLTSRYPEPGLPSLLITRCLRLQIMNLHALWTKPWVSRSHN